MEFYFPLTLIILTYWVFAILSFTAPRQKTLSPEEQVEKIRLMSLPIHYRDPIHSLVGLVGVLEHLLSQVCRKETGVESVQSSIGELVQEYRDRFQTVKPQTILMALGVRNDILHASGKRSIPPTAGQLADAIHFTNQAIFDVTKWSNCDRATAHEAILCAHRKYSSRDEFDHANRWNIRWNLCCVVFALHVSSIGIAYSAWLLLSPTSRVLETALFISSLLMMVIAPSFIVYFQAWRFFSRNRYLSMAANSAREKSELKVALVSPFPEEANDELTKYGMPAGTRTLALITEFGAKEEKLVDLIVLFEAILMRSANLEDISYQPNIRELIASSELDLDNSAMETFLLARNQLVHGSGRLSKSELANALEQTEPLKDAILRSTENLPQHLRQAIVIGWHCNLLHAWQCIYNNDHLCRTDLKIWGPFQFVCVLVCMVSLIVLPGIFYWLTH